MRAERGAGGLFALVVITLAMIAVLALGVLLRVTTNVGDATQTTANLKTAAAALEQFAGASGRLPCPADPSTDNGLASPVGASRDCDFTQGTLPWATIGMRRDDAYDAWGWKISYRVYSNTNGSLTQANGASMVNCDTVQALNPQPVDGNNLCPIAHDTLDTAFLAGKGLTVTDFGTTINGASSTGGAAYVLISHGSTGLGAWTSAGAQKDNPKSTEEKNNMKDTGPFTLMAASGPEVPADDNNHFDDILFYRTVLDLAKKANLVARDWPNDVVSDVTFDQATVQTALGGANPSGNGGDTGQTSISFNPARQQATTVSGFNSGSAQDIGYTGGSTPGLGVVGGGSNDLTSTGGEGIRVDFVTQDDKLAVTLNNFGVNFSWIEQAEFRFYNKGALVGPPIMKQGCRADGTSTLASFSITPSGPFDRVEIRPQNTNAVFGFSIPSSFIVSEVATCPAAVSSCKTQLDTVANECP
jgi:type II secretory pathway pseudopilin PulG